MRSNTYILVTQANEKLGQECCDISRDSAKYHTTIRVKFRSAEADITYPSRSLRHDWLW